jgi:hypothetical protein
MTEYLLHKKSGTLPALLISFFWRLMLFSEHLNDIAQLPFCYPRFQKLDFSLVFWGPLIPLSSGFLFCLITRGSRVFCMSPVSLKGFLWD